MIHFSSILIQKVANHIQSSQTQYTSYTATYTTFGLSSSLTQHIPGNMIYYLSKRIEKTTVLETQHLKNLTTFHHYEEDRNITFMTHSKPMRIVRKRFVGFNQTLERTKNSILPIRNSLSNYKSNNILHKDLNIPYIKKKNIQISNIP